jgi:hypothetical protein
MPLHYLHYLVTPEIQFICDGNHYQFHHVLVHYCEFCTVTTTLVIYWKLRVLWVSDCMNCIILEEPHVYVLYHSDHLDVQIMFVSNHATL